MNRNFGNPIGADAQADNRVDIICHLEGAYSWHCTKLTMMSNSMGVGGG